MSLVADVCASRSPSFSCVTRGGLGGTFVQAFPFALLYQSPTLSLRGKGDEAMWTVGRMVPINCKVG